MPADAQAGPGPSCVAVISSRAGHNMASPQTRNVVVKIKLAVLRLRSSGVESRE